MATHTPAPWKLQDRGDRWSIAGPDGAGLAACTGNVRRPDAEKSANARLIAAAPEMRDLLERVAAFCPVEEQDEIRALLAEIDVEPVKGSA